MINQGIDPFADMLAVQSAVREAGFDCYLDEHFKYFLPDTGRIGRLICSTNERHLKEIGRRSFTVHPTTDKWLIGFWSGRILRMGRSDRLVEFIVGCLGDELRDTLINAEVESAYELSSLVPSGPGWVMSVAICKDGPYSSIAEADKKKAPPCFSVEQLRQTLSITVEHVYVRDNGEIVIQDLGHSLRTRCVDGVNACVGAHFFEIDCPEDCEEYLPSHRILLDKLCGLMKWKVLPMPE